jgi:hypothetical protein
LSFTLPQNWEKLGSKKVSFRVDRDTIAVGAHEGAFTKLKVQVTGGAINMRKMIVNFRNGESQDVSLKHNFARGGGSRVIDLPGNRRIINKIVFVYDTKNRSRSRATVHVFGRH